MEIRAVALRNVAIKGVHSTRYLCMGADGRMRGLVGVTTGRDALGRGTYGCPGPGLQGGGRSPLASSAGAGMELAMEFDKGRMKEANVQLFFYGSLGSRPLAGEWARVAFAFRVEPKAVSIGRWETHYWLWF